MTDNDSEQVVIDDEQAIQARMSEIGRRLRRVRLSQRLSLSSVAQQTGLTKGFLSQLERGETSVSIANLFRISSILGIPASRLFDINEPDTGPLVRREHKVVGFMNDGVMEYRLTPAAERRFEACEAHLHPSGSYGGELYSLEAELGFVYALEGEVDACFADHVVRLRQGDALTFCPSDPHTFRNPSSAVEAVLLFLKSPAIT